MKELKIYEFQAKQIEGLTPNYLREIEERIIWRLQTEFKDKHDLVQQIVADNFENLHKRLAACASGAVDTVAACGISKHVCGAQGYNPMLGDTCEGCENERKSSEGQP